MLKCQQATILGFPSYDIFVPQKVPHLKIFDDVIAWWFVVWTPPIKNSDYAYELEIAWKKFWWPFFFWEHLRLCPWFLASSIPVLGLERVCPRKGCPWPWALYPRLHLWWKSMWNKRKDCLRMKESVGLTSSRLAIRLLNLKILQLNTAVQVLTGHCNLTTVRVESVSKM